MFKAYAFSFDRETFRGEFATREQAIDAGLIAAIEHKLPVEAVFIGKRVPTDPQADGHAEEVVKSMRRRMQTRTGDTSYLAAANEHLQADLDASLEHAIVDWLRRHKLQPADKFTSLSEHPLPTVLAHGPDRNDEVHMMGPDSEM